jgi:hypothetical protein
MQKGIPICTIEVSVAMNHELEEKFMTGIHRWNSASRINRTKRRLAIIRLKMLSVRATP